MLTGRRVAHGAFALTLAGGVGAIAPAAQASEGVPSAPNSLLQLTAVDTLSSSDAWVVGLVGSYPFTTYAAHWDGSSWTRSATLDPSSLDVLTAVSADSPTDVWAVGYGSDTTLVEHYDGTQWSVVDTPNFEASPMFSAVDAVSPTDVWGLVHELGGRASRGAMVVHYDGSQWTTVSVPPVGRGPSWSSITMTPQSSDGWLVGNHGAGTVGGGDALHWDGSAWSKVKLPGQEGFVVGGGAEESASDAWIVGESSTYRGVILHWDGTAWAPTTLPKFVGDRVYLESVTADAPSDAWATGTVEDRKTHQSHSILLHWDGVSWTRSGKHVSGEPFADISASSPENAFVVTIYDKLAYWNGEHWQSDTLHE